MCLNFGYMISVLMHSEELQELMETDSDSKGGKCDMCQAIKEMIEDGRAEGRVYLQTERSTVGFSLFEFLIL